MSELPNNNNILDGKGLENFFTKSSAVISGWKERGIFRSSKRLKLIIKLSP